ncbi:MAG: hypothetical protein AB2L20_00670 [Mangrovibacterium sp.]
MRLISSIAVLFCFCFVFGQGQTKRKSSVIENQTGVRKLKDIVIYQDTHFYSCFPSVIRRPDGEFLVAFRRAPDRRIFREEGNLHVDPNSYLVMVRSTDGEIWTPEPELIYAHPLWRFAGPVYSAVT